jgi:type I restriction enzyme, S subunit
MIGKAHEVARKTLNLEDVRSSAVAIPPRQEQDEIVRLTSDVLSLTDVQELSLDCAARDCASLRQSILKSAFAGRLVPQDPNDEAASVLLARLASEPAENMAKRRGRSRAIR